MADDKKAVPVAHKWHPLEVIIILLVVAAVLGSIFNMASNYLASNSLTFFGVPLSGIKDFFFGESLLFKFISVSISVGSLVGIVFLSHLKGAILIAERAALFPAGDPYAVGMIPTEEDNELKEVWKRIVKLSESESESDWRVAIIEADIILDDLLYKLRLPGDTIGEKLKGVEPSDFLSLEAAWEAHKARNNIAHGGQSISLNQREARRIISLYEKVFKEFYLI